MLLRPTEILSKYPGIRRVWTTNDLGYLLRLGVVSGKKLSRSCLLEVQDVIRVYNLVKKK